MEHNRATLQMCCVMSVCVCVHECEELLSYTGYDDAPIKTREAMEAPWRLQ